MNAPFLLGFRGRVAQLPTRPNMQQLRNATVQLGATMACTFSGMSGDVSTSIRTDAELRAFFNNAAPGELPRILAMEPVAAPQNDLPRQLLAPNMPVVNIKMPDAPKYVIKSRDAQRIYDSFEKLITRLSEHHALNREILRDLTYIIPAANLVAAQ
eukprot:Platyproteum_vivax@DN1498_c0_g1_i2.p1